MLRHGLDGAVDILSEVVLSQIDEHAPYGGVVPEIAARAHADATDTIVQASCSSRVAKPCKTLDAIAATSGPGLIGGVMVGMMTGKALAMARCAKALRSDQSLRRTCLVAALAEACAFPYLLYCW